MEIIGIDNEYIKNLRQELNLSQKRFGDHLGYTASSISLMETGKKPIDKCVLLAIKQISENKDEFKDDDNYCKLCGAKIKKNEKDEYDNNLQAFTMQMNQKIEDEQTDEGEENTEVC